MPKKPSDRVSPSDYLKELHADAPRKGWAVINWSPHADRGPETEVHLVLYWGNSSVILRLKSREAVDDLVAALAKNRDLIWPENSAK